MLHPEVVQVVVGVVSLTCANALHVGVAHEVMLTIAISILGGRLHGLIVGFTHGLLLSPTLLLDYVW